MGSNEEVNPNIKALLFDPKINVMLEGDDARRVYHELVEFEKKYGKPVTICLLAMGLRANLMSIYENVVNAVNSDHNRLTRNDIISVTRLITSLENMCQC